MFARNDQYVEELIETANVLKKKFPDVSTDNLLLTASMIGIQRQMSYLHNIIRDEGSGLLEQVGALISVIRRKY